MPAAIKAALDRCENCGKRKRTVRFRPKADVDLCLACARGLGYIAKRSTK